MSEAVLSSSDTSLVRSMSVTGISDHSDLSFDFLTPFGLLLQAEIALWNLLSPCGASETPLLKDDSRLSWPGEVSGSPFRSSSSDVASDRAEISIMH